MSPQPGILPIVAPSESPPQSLVVTTDDATKTTDTAHMTTAQTMTLKTESVGATKASSSATVTTEGAVVGVTPTLSSCISNENNSRTSVVSDSGSSGSGSSSNSQKSEAHNEEEEKGACSSGDESAVSTTQNEDDDLSTLERPRRILLKTVNPHVICNLCMGYLIDATTIVECLHSFCHSCIMKHLRTEQYCPRCEMMINTAKPNIKPDTTLQAIVYKLVPGLYEKELMRKRAFYRDRPDEAKLATPEQRGEDTEHLIFGPTENMSLSLEYADIEQVSEDDTTGLLTPKYLQCPAIFTVAHLKKFIILKFGIDSQRFTVDIMYKVKTIVLMDHYTLMDVAYIYTWKRDAPMRFFFRVKESEKFERRKRIQAVEQIVKKVAKKESEDENVKTEVNKIEVAQQDSISDTAKEDDVKQDKIEKVEIKKEDIVDEDLKEKKIETPNKVKENSAISDDKMNKDMESVNEAEPETETHRYQTMRSTTQELLPEKPLMPLSSPPPKLQLPTFVELPKEKTPEPKVESSEKSPKTTENSTNDKEVVSEPKTEKLKITLVGKHKHGRCSSASESPKSDSSTSSSKSSKNNRTPKHHHHSSQQKSSPEHEERKVENIKLKIDLSKQNSVTIINMSGPESLRKEIVKSVKPEKEWKMKTKKEKEDRINSPKISPSGESRHQRFEIKSSPPTENSKGVVPPITIKAERINPNERKKSTPSPPPAATVKSKHEELDKDDEEKKSEFLNSFALTPIKPLNSPEKSDKSKPAQSAITGNAITPPVSAAYSVLSPAPVQSPKTTQATKRKNKETMKPPAKKAKSESPKSSNLTDVKNKIVNAEAPSSISFKLAPFPIGGPPIDLEKKQQDEKLMPAPPPLKVIDVFKKNGVKAVKTAKMSKTAASGKVKSATPPAHNTRAVPPGSLTPHPMVPPGIASSKIPITASAPGNRTPIARRYPPILPKSPRPNPFANIPTDVNKLLQNSGTEIKQITGGNGRDVKVYGPPTVTSSSNQKSAMAPPPVQQQSSPSASRSSGKTQNSNNYLNYALFNASKARLSDVPLGCRTPIYTPNSPIYSPNSPQYMPNYNIPTQPTYKYTKSGNAASNYLQNVLGQNKQLSSLFPAPPIKKRPESPTLPNAASNNSNTPPPENDNKKNSGDENSLKRPYPFTRSPPTGGEKIQEPPEKQIKVQSLLNSCNINIPSSLSITITNEDVDSSTNNLLNSKHKSPVNNYIEILKLPDNHPVSPEKPEQKKTGMSLNKQSKKVDEQKDSVSSSSPVPTHPAVFGPSNTKAVSVPKSSPSSITVKSFATVTSPTKQLPSLNPIDKKQHQNENGTSSTANNNSPKNKKTPSPEKRQVEKNPKKGGNQPSAEKKVSQENVAQSKTTKTSSDSNSTQPSKKFRHILPRTTSAPSQQPANKTTTPSPTTSAASKGGPRAQQKPSSTNSTASKKTYSNNNNKKIEEILDLTSSKPSNTLNSPKSPPSTPAPPAVSSDLTTFLSESLLRAQQQAAANNSNGIFIPHLAAAANFNPHFASVNFGYNIQQAYLMEHISRMQKAGHEALEKYMQKLKAGGNSPKSPNNLNAKSSGSDVKE